MTKTSETKKISVIKDSEHLSPNIRIEGMPELIYERPEVKDIRDKIRKYFKKTSPEFITLINGSSGSGKTLSLSYALLENLKTNQDVTWIWVDGNEIKTTTSLYKKICSAVGGHLTARMDSTDFIFMIKEQLNKKGKRVIIVIDEVEKIYHRSKESPAYMFLQSLIRLDVKPRPAFFFLTNEFNFTKYLKPEVTGGMHEVIFPSYSASDIYQILSKRASFCLYKEGYTPDDLNAIAKEIYNNPVAGNQANARNAIDILFTAADMAEEKGVKLQDTLSGAIEKTRLKDYMAQLKKYTPQMQVLIKVLAVMRNEAKKEAKGALLLDNPILNYEPIRERFFQEMANDSMKDMSLRSFENYINILVQDKIISRFAKGKFYFMEDADRIIDAFCKII